MCTDEPLHILRQSAIDEDETDIAYYNDQYVMNRPYNQSHSLE